MRTIKTSNNEVFTFRPWKWEEIIIGTQIISNKNFDGKLEGTITSKYIKDGKLWVSIGSFNFSPQDLLEDFYLLKKGNIMESSAYSDIDVVDSQMLLLFTCGKLLPNYECREIESQDLRSSNLFYFKEIK